ncbi:MAG: hypothetical protein IPN34_19840 [Planctomycetes bacterium]|nr:hypothetical protein [Planctomycetota bacterium]
MTNPPPKTRRQRLEEEIAFLETQLEQVRRDRERAPWLLTGLVLMLPAAYFYSWVGAAIAFVVVATTTGCAFYLSVGHRAEYEDKIARLEAELRALERIAPTPSAAST